MGRKPKEYFDPQRLRLPKSVLGKKSKEKVFLLGTVADTKKYTFRVDFKTGKVTKILKKKKLKKVM